MLAFFFATQLTPAAYATAQPVWHRPGRLVAAPLSVQLSGTAARGEIPPYSLAQRDIAGAELSIAWRPAAPVQLALRWGSYGARWPDGTQMIGPGDLHLSTQARLVKSVGRAPDLWLAWDLKLPNAAQPLGTDEADTQISIWARKSADTWTAALGAGLLIAGHPHQLAAQDDALVMSGRANRTTGPGFLLISGDLRLRSARNPTAAQAGLGWEQPVAERLSIGASIDLGLSPAAPDQSLRLWVALVPGPSGA